jgi:hypothetical protein
MSDLKYALVDLSEFLKASSLNDYLYNQITVSNWQLNRLVCVEYLGVGVTGINISTPMTLDDPFLMFVNGSAYIQDNLVVNQDMYIYGNINISGNADLNTLTVTNFTVFDSAYIKNIDCSNASIINLNTKNMSVNNLSIYTTLISNCDASFNKKIDVSDNATFYNNISINKNATILGNASINSLNVTNSANFNTNISVPLLTVTNNASILNISTYNLNVATNAIINTLNSSYLNVSINANISNINISNASINTLKVFEDTNLHTLNVTNTTTLNNGAIINGPLNSNNLISTNSRLNGDLIINASTIFTNDAYFDSGTSLNIGGNASTIGNTSSLLYIKGQTYIQTLYVGEIFTDTQIQQTNTNIITNLGIGQFSIRNTKPTTRDCYCYIGESNTPVYLDLYSYGEFNFGVKKTSVPESLTYISSFNMIAKSTPILPITSLNDISNNGIIYEGPIQIGNTSTSLLNISAKGSINYDGSMNIGMNTRTLLNISSHGIINIRNLSSVDLSFNTILDIDASSVLQGIKYRGKLDVSGNFFLDGNINLTGNVYSRSDIKIKNNITKLENAITKIQNLNGYTYTRSDLTNMSKIHIGLIAQEVEKEYPEIISEENGIKTINYTSMIAILLESIKDLKKEINELRVK